MRQPKLFSYVVDHDHGFAPNPFGKFCTLVHCKFSHSGRKNVVEAAEPGDWILGTGGKSSDSSGNGTIIYLMRVDEKLPFPRYMRDRRFSGRLDHCDTGEGNKFALASTHFFYFGQNAVSVRCLPELFQRAGLEKRGPGFRSDLTFDLLQQFIQWFEGTFENGIHGDPCSPLSKADIEAIHRRSIPGAGSLCRRPSSTRIEHVKPREVCISEGSLCRVLDI